MAIGVRVNRNPQDLGAVGPLVHGTTYSMQNKSESRLSIIGINPVADINAEAVVLAEQVIEPWETIRVVPTATDGPTIFYRTGDGVVSFEESL